MRNSIWLVFAGVCVSGLLIAAVYAQCPNCPPPIVTSPRVTDKPVKPVSGKPAAVVPKSNPSARLVPDKADPELTQPDCPTDHPCPAITPAGQLEIVRRGNFVEEVGGTQSAEARAFADAVSVPEDDSDKWYLSLIVKDGDAASKKLQVDFSLRPELRAWGSDTPESPTHFQVRRADDETQQDWVKPITSALGNHGWPVVVIQPPRNRQFGEPSTVAKLVIGYDGDYKSLSDNIRNAIKTYCNALIASKKTGEPVAPTLAELATPTWHSKNYLLTQGIGVEPPFKVLPRPVDPKKPDGPQEWPPSKPDPLTLTQVRKILKEVSDGKAPASLAREIYEQKPTNEDEVLQAWDEWVEENDATPPEPAVGPTPPFQLPADWKGYLIAVLITLGVVYYLQSRQKPTP